MNIAVKKHRQNTTNKLTIKIKFYAYLFYVLVLEQRRIRILTRLVLSAKFHIGMQYEN